MFLNYYSILSFHNYFLTYRMINIDPFFWENPFKFLSRINLRNKIRKNNFILIIKKKKKFNTKKRSRFYEAPEYDRPIELSKKNLKKKKPTFPSLIQRVEPKRGTWIGGSVPSPVDVAGRRNAVTVPEFRSDFHLRRPSKADNDPDACVQLTFLPSRYRVDKRVVVRGSVGLRKPPVSG